MVVGILRKNMLFNDDKLNCFFFAQLAPEITFFINFTASYGEAQSE